MLSNVLAADSPDRAMISLCSSLQWIRLVNFCKDKFRTQQWWPTILSRSSGFRNRAENVSKLPQHSDIHRTRKGKRVAMLQRELPKCGHGKNIIRERQRSSSDQPELFHTHDRCESTTSRKSCCVLLSFPGDKSSGATPPRPPSAPPRGASSPFSSRGLISKTLRGPTQPWGFQFSDTTVLMSEARQAGQLTEATEMSSSSQEQTTEGAQLSTRDCGTQTFHVA